MIAIVVVTVECRRENFFCAQLLADEANGLIRGK